MGSGVADVRRRCHANGLERFAGDAGRKGSQDDVFAVLLDRDFLKAVEIGEQHPPFRFQLCRYQSLFLLFAQHDGQQNTKHMATDRHSDLVIDRPGRQQRRGQAAVARCGDAAFGFLLEGVKDIDHACEAH